MNDNLKESQAKYDAANRERRNYLKTRTTARSFIRRKAIYSDLQELENMIKNKKTEMENDYMYKLIALEEGQQQSVEYFDSFEDLKKHLLTEDYFSWIQEQEPEKELPDFEDVESVEDIEDVFEEYDYSWWRMEVERNG